MSKEFDPMAWLDGQKGLIETSENAENPKIVTSSESEPQEDSIEVTLDIAKESNPLLEEELPSVFHKVNRESVNDFVKTHKDRLDVDLSEVNEIDSAGLQGLLALHKHGVKLINPKDDLKAKLDLVGAGFIIS